MGSDRRRRSGSLDPVHALYGRSRRRYQEGREKPAESGSAGGAAEVSATAVFVAPRTARRERRMARQEIAAAVEAGLPPDTEARRPAARGWLAAVVRWVSWLSLMALATAGAAWVGYQYAPMILERLDRWLHGRI